MMPDPPAAIGADLLRLAEWMRAREAELIELHQALVRVPSVNFGDGRSAREAEAARVAADYLRRYDIDSRTERQQPERDNLLAELNGDGGPSLLWMSHSDVVPPGDEAAWSHPPFAGAIADGRIYGRGANDCKMLVAAQLFALAALKDLGLARRGRLRLAVAADEEVGGDLGFGYLAREHGEWLRSDLALCEGGGACLGRFEDGRPVIAVGSGEKGRYEVTFTARGEGGHACAPWGRVNPLATITEVVRRLDAWQPEVRTISPVFELAGRWAGVSGPVTPANVETVIERMRRRSEDFGRSLMGQSRMILTPTVVHAGDKSNALPTEARLACDARLLPGQGLEDLRCIVAELTGDLARLEVEFEAVSPPSVSEFTAELEAMFAGASARAAGEAVLITPTWATGASDARFVRELGTPVYGYQLNHPSADPERLGIHCIDESIEVNMLRPCAYSLADFALQFWNAG